MEPISKIHQAVRGQVASWINQNSLNENVSFDEAENLVSILLPLFDPREAELVLDTAEIVERVRDRRMTERQDGSGLVSWWNMTPAECGALIGQYAYRYSEDICKERDEWKAMCEEFSAIIMTKAQK